MNSVDYMDQRRSTNLTRRKEQRVSMNIFTCLLDLGLSNVYCLYEQVHSSTEPQISFRNFKRKVCEALIIPFQESRKRKYLQISEKPQYSNIATSIIGTIGTDHMLMENLDKSDIHCFLCLMSDKKKKKIYGCVACKKGFYVNCFTALHCSLALTGNTKPLVTLLLKTNEEKMSSSMARKSKHR